MEPPIEGVLGEFAMVAIHHHHTEDRRSWAHVWSRSHGHLNWPRIALLAGVLGFWCVAAAVAAHLL